MQGRVLAAVTWGLLLAVFAGSANGEALAPPRGKHRGWYFVDRAGTGHFGEMVVAKELLPRLEPYRGKRVEIDITKAHRNFTVGPFTIVAFTTVTLLPPPPISIRLWSRPSHETPGSVDAYCTVTKSNDFPAGDETLPQIEIWWDGNRREADSAGGTRPATWFCGEYCFVTRTPTNSIVGTSIDRDAGMKPGESLTYALDPLSGLTGACDVGVRVRFQGATGEPIVGEARMPIDFPAAGRAKTGAAVE